MARARGGKEGKMECKEAADRDKVSVRVCAMIVAVRGTENKTPISLNGISLYLAKEKYPK
jgi:hypothetical protein